MPTRNVVLTDYQEQLIERLVETGRFQNASEVLREGVRLVEERESRHKESIKALRAELQIGIADIEAGRSAVYSASEFRNRVKTLARQGIAKATRASKRR